MTWFSQKQEYDLVTCAFTLVELANMKERLEVIERLWEKLAHNGYLVGLVISHLHERQLSSR